MKWKLNKCKLTQEQIDEVTSDEYVTSQLHKSISGRCRDINEKYGVRICPFTLRRYNKIRKVRWKKPKRWMQSSKKEEQLKVERMAYLTILLERLEAGSLIIYVDECKC